MAERRQSRARVPVGFKVRPALRVPLLLGLCSVLFAFDYALPETIAVESLYAIPLVLAFWVGSTRGALLVAAVCAVLGFVGIHADSSGGLLAERFTEHAVGVNRAFLLFSLGVVTWLGHMRLRIERELHETRDAVQTTLESIAEGVITIDTGGCVSFMNPIAEQLLGVTKDEALGKPLEASYVVVDERPLRAPVVELRHGAASSLREGELRAKNGRTIAIQETRAPVFSRSRTLYGHVIVVRDVTAQREHEEAMRRMAYRDEVTGLPNRVSLTDRLSLELAHARRNRELLAVCYVDLDGFKEINDSFGHHVGDAFLKGIAERLRGALRGGDTIARLGGDEFVILLPGIGDANGASHVARKVLEALELPIQVDGRQLKASASLGLALFPLHGEEPETLLRRADKAMYRAKQSGGARVELANAAR